MSVSRGVTSSSFSVGRALRDTIELQRPVRVSDGQGGFRVTWQAFMRGQGNVTPMKLESRTRLQAWGNMDVSHMVHMRYVPGVEPQMRIAVLNVGVPSIMLEIKTVENLDNRRRWLRLICLEQSIKQQN